MKFKNLLYLFIVIIFFSSCCPGITGVTITNITSTSARINWTGSDEYFGMEVEYGLSGFTIGTGTIDFTSGTDFYDIEDLSPSTTYQVYLIGDCFLEITSRSGPHTFTTLGPCGIAPVLTIDDVHACETKSFDLHVATEGTAPADLNYLWYSDATLTTLVDTGTSFTTPMLSTTRSYFILGMYNSNACSTEVKEIVVNIHPAFNIDLGNPFLCTGDTINLSPGLGYALYEWNDGSILPYLNISTAGTYNVIVENEYGCIAEDEVIVPEYAKPLTPSSLLYLKCQIDDIKLDAENPGSTYLWSTGETTKTIIVNDAGTYTVVITNENNCSNTFIIEVQDYEEPTTEGFNFIPLHLEGQPLTIRFEPINASSDIAVFEWNFGDGNFSNEKVPTHQYSSVANYDVTLTTQNDCNTYIYSLQIAADDLTDIEDMNKNQINVNVFPNPSENKLNIITKEAYVEKIEIIDMLGRSIIQTSTIKETNVVMDVSTLANGVYSIIIKTSKGTVNKKIQINK